MGVGAGFAAGGNTSKEVCGGVVDSLFASLSLATAFDLEDFDEPPMRLFSKPHLPLAGSSSGKSVASGVNTAAAFGT